MVRISPGTWTLVIQLFTDPFNYYVNAITAQRVNVAIVVIHMSYGATDGQPK